MRINGKPLKRAQRPAPLLSPLGVRQGRATRPAVRTCGPPRQGGSQRGPRPRARGAVACALSASCHCRSQRPAWLGPPHLVRENVGCREYRECQSLQTPLPARPYTLLRRGDPRRTPHAGRAGKSRGCWSICDQEGHGPASGPRPWFLSPAARAAPWGVAAPPDSVLRGGTSPILAPGPR